MRQPLIELSELYAVMGAFFTNTPTAPCISQDEVALDDCLACSGCITSDEAAGFRPDTGFLSNRDSPLAFIISPQAKRSLHGKFRALTYGEFEAALVSFLHTDLNATLVVDTSCFSRTTSSGISSECPAVVLYIERVFPSLLQKLSTEQTHMQKAAEFISQAFLPKSVASMHADNPGLPSDIPRSKIVAVMQCYDKKNEIGRDGTHIDYFIGTRDLYEYMKNADLRNTAYTLLPWECTRKACEEEISGLAQCINMLKGLKSGSISLREEGCELRICKGGCMHGPAQAHSMDEADNKPDFPMGIQDGQEIILRTKERQFAKPKKKTFQIEW